MKKIVLIGVILFNISSFAKESDILNLNSPSQLTKGQSLFSIKHRFIGRADEDIYDGFSGIDGETNIGLSLSYMYDYGIEGKIARNRYTYNGNSEYIYTLSNQQNILSYAKVKVGVDYFSYLSNNSDLKERRENFFYNGSLSTTPILDGLSFIFNIGYDNYYKKLGSAVGINKDFNTDISYLPSVKKIAFMVEYFPILKKKDETKDKKNAFSIGIKFKTQGYHFVLSLSNSTAIGTRQSMLGVNDNNLHLGFNFYKLIF